MDWIDAILGQWDRWPPLRKMVAVALGHKPPEPASKNYDKLLAMFPGGAIR